ncbi:DUF397 domain-containing protein [Actinophytocola sp.]|uniref:DUF397 domain-containing protein n=1 Tax=Actinophytocola sp. TaxID=1872138 RepID=UPI00389985B3
MNALDLSQAEWRKSSRSSSAPNCVEVAWVWRKSSRSTSAANCVEVASGGAVTAVRDSKNTSGPILTFPVSSWAAFLSAEG